ncbi:MAG: ABC transporter ATP-binding protein/permease [Oscillospiraceae bacterium]|nr:ABC transporter ATP-binding protein/permease [Oscillospiraceae bacterium]
MGVVSGFRKLFGLFNRRQKINSVIMLGLIVLGGIAETVGIGVVLPFTTILLDREAIESIPVLYSFTQIPWVGDYRRFIVLMCIVLVLIFVLKSLYMFFLLYVQNRFALNRQIELSKALFSSYIYKPYEFFFGKNTAELQRNVNVLVERVIQNVLMFGLQLLTEVMVVVSIIVLLMIVDPMSTLALGIVLGGVGAAYYFILKGRLDEAAQKQNAYGAGMVKTVNEGLGSVKEVKILKAEKDFLERYGKLGAGFAKTAAFHNMAFSSPRLLIETVAISGLVILVVINVLRSPDMNASLPMIALFGMAAIRIMPSLNRSIGFMTAIRFSLTHFNQIYDDLKEAQNVAASAETSAGRIVMQDGIEIKELTYKYPNADTVIFKNARLTVKKGQAIGIVGSSGVGKTTLVDLLLGLLEPESGEILVDGRNIRDSIGSFRRSIGYVPQDIFIIDDTIAANVAFGIDPSKVDEGRVWEALEIANLKEFTKSLSEKLNTNVGESGTRLSGGQRQRLGIARAIYNNPEILIFDEATSSLDNESERIISEAITAIGQTKTMIIIAHRLNTLDKCDVIYEIKDKAIIKTEL